MQENRWIINRTGLVNFWYYDEEEFNFSDGRLLLRGSNGSGKSVTMQSFIPLLLDGNKSPERLDPFGSKARKIENYLLGDEDSGKDESLGYLYMEFKKRETENYLTIGMGFKAVRGKSIKSWGFAITDGRRIGKDFFLYKNAGEKLPLTMKELENRLGAGGQIKEGQKDYMKLVNDLVFGFSDVEEYDEMIKLLVQLRTPKLSKDFKPTVVYEIMENSLQQLSEDDLRPMSEAIENMDGIKSRLEELKEGKKAADKIRTAFDKYNTFIINNKAKLYIDNKSEAEKLEKEEDTFEKEKSRAELARIEAEEEIDNIDIRLKTTEEKRRELDKHDSVKIREKIEILEDDIKSYNKERSEKDSHLQRKKTSEKETYDNIRSLEGKKEGAASRFQDKINIMDDIAYEFSFDEQQFLKDEIGKEIDKEYSFSYIKDRLNKYTNSIDKALKVIEEESKKNLEYDKVLHSLEKSKKEKEEKNRVLDETLLLLSETKEEYIEKLYGWRKDNLELKLSDKAMIDISREVNGFEASKSFDGVLAHIREEYNGFQENLNKELYEEKGKRAELQKKATVKKEEIKQWRDKKDPEPPREDKVTENREKLTEEGIPYIPFYKAIDFLQDISEETKGKIEEALLDMGILDALIVPEGFRAKVMAKDREGADKYLFSEPKFLVHELSELLKSEAITVSGLKREEVEDVLKTILIDESKDSTYINENGDYSIGLLKGRVSKSYIPKYIGVAARKKYREEQIEKLSQELILLEEELSLIDKKLAEINNRLEKLKLEYNSLPQQKDLIVAVEEVKKAQFEYDMSVSQVLKITEEERKVYGELKELKEKVYELTHSIPIKPNLEEYKNALEASRDYKDELYELEKLHREILQMSEKIKLLEDQRETLLEDIDNLLYDINLLERRSDEAKINLNNLKQQLQLSDYETIKLELEACLKVLKELPKQREEAVVKKTDEKNKFERSVERLEQLEERLAYYKKLSNYYEQVFKEECSLGYYIVVEENEDYFKLAKKIVRESLSEEKNAKEREDYISTLHQRFHENNQYLREYNVRVENLFDFLEYEDEVINKAAAQRKRLNLVGKVRGKDVNFYKLLEFINEGIEENEKLLRESDRQLFEDILVKNISKKIRAKIFHSEQWVDKMNELMESMNTSSGLSFSLKWTSKKAETEEQLDTKELVELLKQDGNLMKEEDLNKLSEHFRSKIAVARRELEDKGQNQTFHVIMKEILDYRRWFEFKLFFVKTGQNRKELTNNAFYQFSGGEKAMAMYVPLFSAVYARYKGARKDCPRIIGLDEAFAGVDEKNISDMFRLLDELGLDYVLNSQILWGDYETVPSLAICELIRPDNADFVTVIRYNWNGKVKELVV
ncbi:TIGR02680 family protein [Clostridium manihotivorum]|uniref:TIGR02680 family protein n=1 Tax=Clostridium manihotivorum TaxID=2320868 RepID=A0A3R5X3H2_9CLOT|nr:TIGR02680 family protein [Clostridium manihotivorum]QAA33568.1 TIGR02680 family protein [Clostridium manihotivorum]